MQNYSGFIKFSNRIEPSFLSSGFKDWNDATRRFKGHQSSDLHKEAVIKLTAQPIDESLSKAVKEQKSTNRKMLKKVIEVMIYLCRQGIPLRG